MDLAPLLPSRDLIWGYSFILLSLEALDNPGNVCGITINDSDNISALGSIPTSYSHYDHRCFSCTHFIRMDTEPRKRVWPTQGPQLVTDGVRSTCRQGRRKEVPEEHASTQSDPNCLKTQV